MADYKVVNGPWNDMIDMTSYSGDPITPRAICIYLESLIEAQNETNRLLAKLIGDEDDQ